jgi:hypothetical protein
MAAVTTGRLEQVEKKDVLYLITPHVLCTAQTLVLADAAPYVVYFKVMYS